MPQSLNNFLLRLHALDDRVCVGISRKLITAVDAARCFTQIQGIVARTVLCNIDRPNLFKLFI